MPEDTKQLLVEVRAMAEQIKRLDAHIDISQRSVKRLRIVTYICVMLLGIGIGATWFIVDLYRGVRESQVAACENRNDSADASRQLWVYVMDVSEQANPDANAQQQKFYKDMRVYINRIYARRDCTDLTKKYPLPKPPSSNGFRK